MNPVKTFSPGLLAILLLAASGCASSKRMMRFYPGGGDHETPIEAAGGEERVNMWPFFHAEGGSVSALWPMVDVDKRGFAVRPLFNKEDSEYSILFPLIAWNPVNRDGWCLPAYWSDKSAGAFPLAHFHEDGFHYLLPVYWDSNEGYYGSPVVCHFSKGFNFAGPVWWRAPSDISGSLSASYGVFPLFLQANNLHAIGPFWIRTAGDEGWRGGLFPIFKESAGEGYLFPLYKHSSDENGGIFISPLAAYSTDAKKGDSRLWAFNWYSSKDKEGSVRTLLPLYLNISDERESTSITPFGGLSYRKEGGEICMVNILGPLYTSMDRERESIRSVMFPLSYFSSSKDGGKRTRFVFPWFHRESGNHVTDGILPLYWYDSHDSSLILPAFLSSRARGGEEWNILFPLFHSGKDELRLWPLVSWKDDLPSLFNRNTDGFSIIGSLLYKYSDAERSYESYPWKSSIEEKAVALKKEGRHPVNRTISHRTLLFAVHSERRDSSGILPIYGNTTYFKESNAILFNCSVSRGRVVSEGAKDFSALHKELREMAELERSNGSTKDSNSTKIAAGKAKVAEILKNHGISKASSDEELAAGLAELDAKFTRDTVSETWNVPMIFKDEMIDGRGRGDILWFISRWNSEGTKSRLSVLEYMYRHERDGEFSRYDVFPFVSVDKGPESFHCSFLWRFASYRKDKDGVHLHALFVPVL